MKEGRHRESERGGREGLRKNCGGEGGRRGVETSFILHIVEFFFHL